MRLRDSAVYLLTLGLSMTLSCASHRSVSHLIGAELTGARLEAEDYVRLVKNNFSPADVEYRHTEFLYAQLRSSYECWLRGAIDAVEDGLNPTLELQFSSCAERAPDQRSEFGEHIRRAIESPRARPQPSPTLSVSRGERVKNNIQTVTQILEVFDRLTEVWVKLYERYRAANAAERTRVVARLKELHWRQFDQIK